jgi:hypothetical protein
LIVRHRFSSLIGLVRVGGAGFARDVGDISLILVVAPTTHLAGVAVFDFVTFGTRFAILLGIVLGLVLAVVVDETTHAGLAGCATGGVGTLVLPNPAHGAAGGWIDIFSARGTKFAIVHRIVQRVIDRLKNITAKGAGCALETVVQMALGLVLAVRTNVAF